MGALMLMLLAAVLVQATTPSPVEAQVRLGSACRALSQRTDLGAMELHNLATCFLGGDGVAQDPARARELYAQAAARGFTQSECALGNMMVDGRGGARDIAGGLARCRRAAEAGEPQAQTDLANYLLTGQVVARNVVEARRWYTLAAEQGQANAAFVLGQIYWNGDGVEKNNAEAARWWRVAYEGGRADAAYLLGREGFVRLASTLERPADVDQSLLQETLAWFERAARTDPTEANREDAARSAALLQELQSPSRR